MNKIIRHSYICNKWSQKEVLLDYLRVCGAFSHSNGNTHASPYWYGSIYDYAAGERIIRDLLDNKSIKRSRLIEMIADMAEDLHSPIVMIAGLALQRKFLLYTEKP